MIKGFKKRILGMGIIGGFFTTLGGIGAFGVCHTICQLIIIALAAVGITFIGMPLAFLADPKFIILFFIIGLFFFGAAIYFWRKRRCS